MAPMPWFPFSALVAVGISMQRPFKTRTRAVMWGAVLAACVAMDAFSFVVLVLGWRPH